MVCIEKLETELCNHKIFVESPQSNKRIESRVIDIVPPCVQYDSFLLLIHLVLYITLLVGASSGVLGSGASSSDFDTAIVFDASSGANNSASSVDSATRGSNM
jgi:hypothetical protein